MDEGREAYREMDRNTDEHGNPIQPTEEEYGNQIARNQASGTPTGGLTGAATHASMHGSGGVTTGAGYEHGEKGMMDKIKEKMPGHHAGTTPGSYASGTTEHAQEHREKKGVMEKINDKLPGTGHLID
ncbi:hypothetical protein ACHQM5_015404 [Ranunculus cassubicifolius]